MLTALLLSLAVQSTSHENLHPLGAEWFVESPDVPALLDAYSTAPMARLFADEKAVAALRKMLGAEELTGAGLVERGLAELGDGWTLAQLRQLRAVSASMRSATDARAAAGLLVLEAVSADAATEVTRLVEQLDLGAWVQQDDVYVAVGVRDFPVAEWAALRAGEAPTVLADLAFQADAVLLNPTESPVVLRGFQRKNAFALLEQLADLDLAPLTDAWQFLMGEGTTHFRMALEHGRFVSETYSPGAPSPIAGAPWLGGKPLDPAILDEVHPDCLFVSAASFDAQGLRAFLEGALAADLGSAALFDKLGSNGVLFLQPIKGPSLPKGFAVAELRDAEGVLDDVVALAALLGDEVESKESKYKGVPYVSLTLPPEYASVGDLGTLRPVFCVLDDKLFLTNGTLGLKAEIRRRAGDEREQHGPSSYPWTRFEGVFDGASAAFYVDWAAQLDGLFSLARAFGGMLANSGLPFDLTALPPSTLFTQHMPPTMHVVRARGGGVHHRHAAGFAFETWIGGVGLARVVMDAMSGDAEPRASAAPVEPEASSPEADTRARLRDLRTALTVYKIDQGAFPDELQRLVEPTTNYPSGYLDGRATLSTDGWGRPFRYARTADGASYRVWSVGPDGVDQDGAGDDVRDL